ncbi:MAG: DUF551 domain-containing protein [Hydrogeniiclostridium sp.]
MARMIDKQTMLGLIIEAERTDPETGSFAEWLAEYLVEHIPTSTRSAGWISVEERLPERFEPVLVCREKNGSPYVEQGYKDVGEWWKVYGTRTKQITHWMPLPEPPEEATP